MNFVSKVMNFVSEMMKCVSEMMNCGFIMIPFVFQMMRFVLVRREARSLLAFRQDPERGYDCNAGGSHEPH